MTLDGAELRAEMRRIIDRIAKEMKAIVNPLAWQEPESLRRITPTSAECWEYFRTATEPPPRRFKFVRRFA